MSIKKRHFVQTIAFASLLSLMACSTNSLDTNSPEDSFSGLKIKVLVGSALGDFCNKAAQNFNSTQPKLDNGTEFQVRCESQGSGDVVNKVISLATGLKDGTVQANAEDFPTIISVDGDIYHSQLIYRMNQIFPGQNYIPEITDAELVANTPMVFMAQSDVAAAVRKAPDPYKALVTAKTHRDIDPAAPATPVYYVHSAPTRSNSGLQTLVAQYSSVSSKRPEQLTTVDVQQFQPQIQQIQSKITRYGVSTNSLANAMVKNGPFWASIASVYESSVINANSGLQQGQQRYEAIYPKSTFTSNMRAILPNAPWVSTEKKAGADKFIAYMRSTETQKIAMDLGLRPGVPGVALSAKFSKEFGVDPQARYDSLRPPKPEVVEAMLKSWQESSKKASQVVIVVDTSGSMEGSKIAAAQTTLQNYVNNLGPKEQIALIEFNSVIKPPVLVDGTPQGKERGLQFIGSLKADGGTSLYDAALEARNWLKNNLRKDSINAVLVLTDGEDSGSKINLEELGQELQKTSFNSDQRIAFFTVGYGNEGEFSPEALKKIAELNGGYYSKGDPETISRLMADLQVEF